MAGQLRLSSHATRNTRNTPRIPASARVHMDDINSSNVHVSRRPARARPSIRPGAGQVMMVNRPGAGD